MYSRDRGETWQVGEVIFKDELINPSECALAVTSNEEVLISIRHEGVKRTRAIAQSHDGISKWYGLRYESNLKDLVCMGSMTYRDGTIYHINCDSESERKKLTLTISKDGFVNCRKITISDMGGYADIALIQNKIFVIYEKTIPNIEKGWKPFSLYFDVIVNP